MSNEELAVAYQQGDADILLELWMQVEKLAVHLVKRYLGLARSNRAVDFEDLMQCAFLGAEKAARTFREGEGSFTTIMGWAVQNEANALLGLKGRVRKEHYESVSADAPISEDSTATRGEMIADDSLPDPDADLFQEDIRREVHAAFDRLQERRAEMVRLNYIEGKSYRTIAGEIGILPERVKQLVQAGRNDLHKDWRLRRLADDVIEARAYIHKSVAAFKRDWTSTTEAAALWRMER